MRKGACVIAGVAAFWAGVAGCATKLHPYEIEPGNEGAKSVGTIALLPLNLVIALPAELEYPSRRVSAEIAHYIRDAGREVATVRLFEARRLLASLGSGDSQDPETTARRFVASLRETRAFDVVVMPSLVYRDAKIRAVTRRVDWDGVSRELAVVGYVHKTGSVLWMGDFHGKMPGVSLYLRVFDAQGNRVFESFAGLDLVHEADISGMDETRMFEWRLKRERLTDDAALREGVRLAFDPYLPPAPAHTDATP